MDSKTLSSLASEDYCYLTTTGRVTGHPHEIEIWFGMDGDTIYLLSGGGEKSDWVKMARPAAGEGEDCKEEVHGAGAL
jgi:nitroimidazol reductase NimA-like FMN-containing flavoprotein (pyridoxamine 5'-phosphate oxidase superfamily)